MYFPRWCTPAGFITSPSLLSCWTLWVCGNWCLTEAINCWCDRHIPWLISLPWLAYCYLSFPLIPCVFRKLTLQHVTASHCSFKKRVGVTWVRYTGSLPLTLQDCTPRCGWWQFFRKLFPKQGAETVLPCAETQCPPYSCKTLRHHDWQTPGKVWCHHGVSQNTISSYSSESWACWTLVPSALGPSEGQLWTLSDRAQGLMCSESGKPRALVSC